MGKPSSKVKGEILEDLVAALHRLPSMRVDARIKLQSVRSNSKRKREIDVLLTTEVAGYPVQIAFSCKNERRKVKTSQVGDFIAALDDVGIPRAYGVIVTPNGFTSDALRMTEEHGLRPLIFEGLDDSRLTAAVATAMRSVIYIACQWRDIQYFECRDSVPDERPPSWCGIASDAIVPVPQGELKVLAPHLLNHVWELWRDGRIPLTLGKHSLFLRLATTEPAEAMGQRGIAFVEVQVIALIASLTGTLTDTRLRHARTQQLEKRRISVTFPDVEGPVKLTLLETEEAVQANLSGTQSLTVVQRVRVPRLLSTGSYWPPTHQALRRIEELRREGKAITFEDVEGTNIAKAWEFVGPAPRQSGAAEEHPSA